jgi:hypothetical protein
MTILLPKSSRFITIRASYTVRPMGATTTGSHLSIEQSHSDRLMYTKLMAAGPYPAVKVVPSTLNSMESIILWLFDKKLTWTHSN